MIRLLRWFLAGFSSNRLCTVIVYDIYGEGVRGPVLLRKDVLYAFYPEHWENGADALLPDGASNIRVYSVLDDGGRLHVEH